ncbi:hypothetical protein Hs30E_01580 [Lactococcus hodotermopsidis]|uniref:Haloacid dehalogenase n=1 Tax=Pseudolactococcus hodotermopsidis TaxID=2709157 RepID=A0A6A0BCR6_9LACT|nr:Cof-type HAD-IIB family hydrolase [Lactococcus hodotermopsidis]GFH41607.1 hypothetical protein Hs30E_01580 [Lactococcus hodotermopsidis]
MAKKIAFFDIDGTLVGNTSIPTQAVIDSIHKFQADGNLAFICTGRSTPEIGAIILDLGFDGIIGAGGGFASLGDDIIHHHTMPDTAVHEILGFFETHDIAYYLECNNALRGSDNYKAKIDETIADYCHHDQAKIDKLTNDSKWFYDLVDSYAERTIDFNDVNKISFINKDLPYQTIADKFGDKFEMFHMTVPFFGKESGEIAVKGNDKQTAIEIVLDKLGLTKADAISFGDANNDLAMFRACGYNVAMGNGTDEIKAAASEVTADVEHDGIAASFEKNNYFKS